MSTDTDEAVRQGTANLFADLGYADADAHLLKAELVRRIQRRIESRELSGGGRLPPLTPVGS